MKLLALLISFLLVFCVFKSVQTDDKTGIQDVQTVNIPSTILRAKSTEVDVTEITVDTVTVLVNVIQILVESEILQSLSSLLGPIGSLLGVTKSIMGLFNTEPDIERLFAEQNKFLRQSFKDTSNQVLAAYLTNI